MGQRTETNDIGAFALGCMGMGGVYGPADEKESIATILEAIDRGVTYFDTGDFYGMGRSELLLGRALAERRNVRDQLTISVKFGALRGPDGSWIGFDARPVAVKTAAAYSLVRMGLERIDVYRPARLDPAVPIEDTVGAIGELIDAGFVGRVALSEVGPETIRRAHAVRPVADLQIEYSLVSRGPEAAIFPVLDELGIGATLYGVLSRGLLTGSRPTGANDYRAHLPRFEARENAATMEALRSFAGQRGMSPAQLAIAWVRTKRPNFMPTLGCRTRKQLDEALSGMSLRLSPQDVREVEAIVEQRGVVGERYPAPQMTMLDSEKPLHA